MSETIEISAYLVRETDLAYLIDDGTKTEWVPKSQTHIELDGKNVDGDEILCFVMPEWLAKKKGFI